MKFSIESRNLTTIKTDLLIVNMHDGKIDAHTFANQVDKKLGGELRRIVKKEKFTGKVGETKLINTYGKIPAAKVLVLGLGDKKNFNLGVVRKGAGKAVQLAKGIKALHVTTAVHGGHLGRFSKGECAQAVVEGMVLAAYSFSQYKKPEKGSQKIRQVVVLCPDRKKIQEVRRGIAKGELGARGASLARDLINTPANDMTPRDLARVARGLRGIKKKVFNVSQIKRMKMRAFLGVAKGSVNEPTLIEMHYRPKGRPKKKVVLVGKGITFDSGGLSLKPPKYMETMKDDMSGAAAVIGLMSVIAQLKPKAEVWGIVAAAENMPDAKAQRPGDIVRTMNGKTVEVLNTDAEGRLTLADAVCYATRKKPDYIIDVATLTGACIVALGDRYSGIMGNDKKLIQKLIDCGNKSGEKIWELPLAEEYKQDLKSPIADLKNVGSGYGGTISGGLFIQEFVGKNKWAHIDIAGPSWTDKSREYEPKGGTGVMVRTLAEFLLSL